MFEIYVGTFIANNYQYTYKLYSDHKCSREEIPQNVCFSLYVKIKKRTNVIWLYHPFSDNFMKTLSEDSDSSMTSLAPTNLETLQMAFEQMAK